MCEVHNTHGTAAPPPKRDAEVALSQARREDTCLGALILSASLLGGGVGVRCGQTAKVGEGGNLWIGCSAGKFRPGGGEAGIYGCWACRALSRLAPRRLWLTTGWPRLRAPGCSRTRWTIAKLIQRHGTIVCTDKASHSESLSWCRLVASWASRSGVFGANLSFAEGPFAVRRKKTLCCDRRFQPVVHIGWAVCPVVAVPISVCSPGPQLPC